MTRTSSGGTELFPTPPPPEGPTRGPEGPSASTVASPTAYRELLESQCGTTDDSQDVEQYDGTLGVSRAFVDARQGPAAQVQWNDGLGAVYTNPGNVSGVRWGSGTLIADDLFLTAGHLFDQTGGGWQRPRRNGTADIVPPAEIATNMRVNFDYQFDPLGNLRPEQSFAITELVEYRLGGLDYAIVRLTGDPAARFGTTAVSAVDAAEQDMAAIIGHPAGVPKRIEAGPITELDGDLIRYDDIDTLGGNSGSGILRADDGLVVGVHTNGGCTASGGSNFGVRIASIIAQSPVLQRLLARRHPRVLADTTGDGRADIVGFGDAGVWLSRATAAAGFTEPQLVVANFAVSAGGWRVHQHPRLLADTTGDGRADIVGFGNAGAYAARARGNGTFTEPQLVVTNFGHDAGGWRVHQHPRFLADTTGDGRADIVGFGNAGVYVARSLEGGRFAEPQIVVGNFGYDAGGWRVAAPRASSPTRPETAARTSSGSATPASTSPAPRRRVLHRAPAGRANFGYDAGGWRVDRHPALPRRHDRRRPSGHRRLRQRRRLRLPRPERRGLHRTPAGRGQLRLRRRRLARRPPPPASSPTPPATAEPTSSGSATPASTSPAPRATGPSPHPSWSCPTSATAQGAGACSGPGRSCRGPNSGGRPPLRFGSRAANPFSLKAWITSLWAVIDEAALRRAVGDRALARAQLGHPLDRNKLPLSLQRHLTEPSIWTSRTIPMFTDLPWSKWSLNSDRPPEPLSSSVESSTRHGAPMPVPTACPASGQDEPSVDNDGVGSGPRLARRIIVGRKRSRAGMDCGKWTIALFCPAPARVNVSVVGEPLCNRYPAGMTTDDHGSGTGIDTTVPHSARIWNYWLGGKDNYPVDREAGDAWLAVHPEIAVAARAGRGLLRRGIRYMAGEAGVRQFLDIGTGLPTADNTHEVAQQVAPDAHVVYVDNDPLILAHARALMTSAPQGATHYLDTDMLDVARMLELAEEHLDFSRPVGVVFMQVLGHVPTAQEARRLVHSVMDAMAPGSYLLIADGVEVEGRRGGAEGPGRVQRLRRRALPAPPPVRPAQPLRRSWSSSSPGWCR
jgi:V8-like Glu-specific endopeptidase